MITEFKLFEKQLELFRPEEMFSLGHNENFLYHVTNIKNLDSIKKYGILPDFGETVRKFYSDYYDFDEPDEDENDEERKIPIYQEIKGVSFFADTPLLGFCTPDIGLSNVKWENMVLCIIEKNDTIFHKIEDYPKFTDSDGDLVDYIGPFSVYDAPSFIETGDWFSFEEQEPKYILHGEELKKFIKVNFPDKLKTYGLNEKYSTTKKWYHYSDVDYVKINPKPTHSDPSGIYMFPEDAINKIVGYWKKKKYRFTITLKPNLRVLNLDTLSKEQELDIVKKLETQDGIAFQSFMKYYKGESEYFNFWQYIRTLYGYKNSFLSRDEFMKLGYDGIYSETIIHSYEPQIIIFKEENINIMGVDERDDLYSPTSEMEKVKDDFIYEILKDGDGLKWYEDESDEYRGFPSYYINVKKEDKSFSIKIHYTGNEDGNIYVNISPYKTNWSYSMGAFVNIYEPDWEDFGLQLTKDLLKAMGEIE